MGLYRDFGEYPPKNKNSPISGFYLVPKNPNMVMFRVMVSIQKNPTKIGALQRFSLFPKNLKMALFRDVH